MDDFEGVSMLNNTNPAVLRCLEKAAECDRHAQKAKDSDGRDMYRRLAENWRFLSENHQHIARMESFLASNSGLELASRHEE